MVKRKLRSSSLIMPSHISICLCISKTIDICKEVLLENWMLFNGNVCNLTQLKISAHQS